MNRLFNFFDSPRLSVPRFLHLFLKQIAGLLIFFFSLSFSINGPLYALIVPEEFGQVSNKTEGTNGRTIVLIQEAHVDYNAQKSIAEILASLVETESLRLILVEGGWGNVSLSELRKRGPVPSRVRVAERYLKEGKISGEEYLDLVSDFDMQLWGVENPDLYRKNMEVFLQIHAQQEKISKELAAFKSALEKLQKKIFSAELQSLLDKKTAFEKQQISLLDYASLLIKESEILKLDAPESLKKIIQAESSQTFNAEQADLEKRQILQTLSKILTKPEFQEIQMLSEIHSTKDEKRLIERLLIAKGQHKLKLNTENLQNYFHILEEMSQIKTEVLFGELNAHAQKICLAIAKTDEQKTLLKISNDFSLLENLLNLKTGIGEFEDYKHRPQDFDLEIWEKKLTEFAKQHSMNDFTLNNIGYLKKQISNADDFYLVAQKREAAMVQNAVSKIEQSQDPISALIVGGFHAENLEKIFSDKGYSVQLVSPRFQITDKKPCSGIILTF